MSREPVKWRGVQGRFVQKINLSLLEPLPILFVCLHELFSSAYTGTSKHPAPSNGVIGGGLVGTADPALASHAVSCLPVFHLRACAVHPVFHVRNQATFVLFLQPHWSLLGDKVFAFEGGAFRVCCRFAKHCSSCSSSCRWQPNKQTIESNSAQSSSQWESHAPVCQQLLHYLCNCCYG